MKEIEMPVKELMANEIQAQQQQRKHKHVHRLRKVPGLCIWEVNLEELTICRARMITSLEIIPTKSGLVERSTHRVDMVSGRVYIQCLNVKNAIRKFQKQYGSEYQLQEVKG